MIDNTSKIITIEDIMETLAISSKKPYIHIFNEENHSICRHEV